MTIDKLVETLNDDFKAHPTLGTSAYSPTGEQYLQFACGKRLTGPATVADQEELLAAMLYEIRFYAWNISDHESRCLYWREKPNFWIHDNGAGDTIQLWARLLITTRSGVGGGRNNHWSNTNPAYTISINDLPMEERYKCQ